MAVDLTGKDFGPFHIERRLGQGAMGSVYRGVHEKNKKAAAIKVMAPAVGKDQEKLAARFEREIKLMGQFRHKNIVRFYGAGDVDGMRYYAMELVDGLSLEEILVREKKLPFLRVVAYGLQLCEAFQTLHEGGVVHRDLKPANVMVDKEHQLKLTDFGIAKDLMAFNETQLTEADHTVGTVAYMSPEQLAGVELTFRSDLYSLGIMLYRMLTGRLPFLGETMFEYVNQRMKGTYPPPSVVADDVPV
ncbi:MAG: serine/threonine protein kinase, partial [Planctomycetia bacterium]